MIRVCTGWHLAGRALYGNKFLESFARHWPDDVQLHVYTEKPEPMDRGVCRNVFSIPGASALGRDLSANPEACGKSPRAGWKDSERRAGYSFRFDAAKFFKQCIIPNDAARDMKDGDVLAWLDGDVVTHARVPVGFPAALLREDDIAFLGRAPKHTELGFWCVRLGPETRAFLDALARCYIGRGVYELREWHSAFVFDHVRGMFPAMKQRDLTPGGHGHVFPTSPVGHLLLHNKGQRKGVEKR